MIVENTSIRGGGVYCGYCSPLILNCLIARNEATGTYGAGGVFGPARLYGCTLTQNKAATPGAAIRGYPAGRVRAYNSVLWGDQPDEAYEAIIVYSDVQGGWTGTANIDLDPLFVDADAGDYHLQAASPCIDTADPAYAPLPGELDLDRQRRVWDGDADGEARLDMGVDEYGSFLYGDLNCDGLVDGDDIRPFIVAFQGRAAYESRYPHCRWLNADVNGDDVVSYADINPFVHLLSPTN